METGRYAAPIHGYGYTVKAGYGKFWFSPVWRGEAVEVCHGWVWSGQICSGGSRRSGLGAVRRGAVRCGSVWLGKAVQVWLGQERCGTAGSGRAV